MTITKRQSPALDRAQYIADWEAWHRGQESRRSDDHGFLAVTTIVWLDEQPQRIPGVPGRWASTALGTVIEIDAEGDDLLQSATSETTSPAALQVPSGHQREITPQGTIVYRLGPIAERSGLTLTFGDIEIEVATRGGRTIVRPRDPRNDLLVQYRGTPVYPPNPRWIASGRFVPFDEPKPVTVGSVSPEIEHVYEAPGVVEFSLRGEEFTLTAFNGRTPGSLLVLFTDATSGLTTYAANRSLHIDAPDASGRVTLDFNRAVNLPCAYTDHATCPLPPAGNRLPVGIEAGEKTPLERG
ncbi:MULTISPECIES: DUF1684 domain-containing protein [unclassified Pseudoclavibacter]|uniref:DUF1684 domain-containing protein n=1 Tax=unclassified Pseudoclavibacter TaxID=2615177 RepID=UPI0013017BFE|nr:MULTISPECIES: DUF1684 domain-containing protein [unclassified Pseudoclavibacter]KAB1644466.1 DUF1684 domain-containing protein [Pseudoclavibacter sp. CFCC 14310]KAB1664030.1 DUF1684 domain-containing protein [Pseudoclavibacter sp. CFCC 13611]